MRDKYSNCFTSKKIPNGSEPLVFVIEGLGTYKYIELNSKSDITTLYQTPNPNRN